MKKLRIAVAAMSAACLIAALPACGSNAAPASNSASTSSSADLAELTADDVKQALDLDYIYIIQNSSNVSIAKAIEGAGFDFIKSVACDDNLDTSLEQSKSVTYKITVDLKALAEKLGLANADQYSGETEFELIGRVKVVSEAEADEVAKKDSEAIIIKTDNEIYQPIVNTGSDDGESPTTDTTGADSGAEATANGRDTTGNDSPKTDSGSTATDNAGASDNTGTGNKNTGSAGSNTGSKNTGSTGGGTTNTGAATGGSTKAEHTHNWQPVYRTVHHDEVGHYETVTVKEAYDEPIYEDRLVCSACGYTVSTVGDAAGEEIADHIDFTHDGRAAYSSKPVKVGTKHHDSVTEQKYVVDQAAYDEKVLDHYECSCGATK